MTEAEVRPQVMVTFIVNGRAEVAVDGQAKNADWRRDGNAILVTVGGETRTLRYNGTALSGGGWRLVRL